MLGLTVSVAAICGLTSAILLPPGIALASEDAPSLSISIVDPNKQSIAIPCAECAFPATQQEKVETDDSNDLFWVQGGANDLLLDFAVSEDGKTLQLDGAPIYPATAVDVSRIYVKQVPAGSSLVDVASGAARSADLEVTAYGLRTTEHPIDSNGDVVTVVDFEVFGLQDKLGFRMLPEVEVKLLQTGTGELMIMEVTPVEKSEKDMFPPPPSQDLDFPLHGIPEDLRLGLPSPFRHGPPPHHSEHHESCLMLPGPLCRLKQAIDAKIDQAMSHGHGFRKEGRPCPGRKGPHGNKMPGHIKPHLDNKEDHEGRPKHHHGRPHHMRPHGPHHGDHGRAFRHHFIHAFAKGVVAVLIPVMAGITVGMTVSLLGLIVGRLIGFAWIKVARGGRRGSASVALREDAIEEGENKAMLAEMEAPPVYEQAPAYEEIAEKDGK